MKINQTLSYIVNKAKKNEWVSFTYEKEDGEISKRTVRFGGKIPEKMERQGTPINGRGAWMTGSASGLRGMVIKKNGKAYLRGTDLNDNKHKVFIIKGIREVK